VGGPGSTDTWAELHLSGRGLHSSTFQLNLSASYGIEGAFRAV